MQNSIDLNDGNKIPVIGLGTWKAKPNEVGDAVRFALTEAEYKHIDCALIYGNEQEIGQIFNDVIGNNIKREELFVTGKLWNTYHHPEDVEKGCRKTLTDLKLDYLDMYLMHWGIAFERGDNLRPFGSDGVRTENVSVQQTWEAMEALIAKGLVKSIGVCNFSTPMLVDLLTYAKIKPVMNQIELHPYNTQEGLVAYCQKNNIGITAYSPLGRPGTIVDAQRIIDEEIVQKLAQKYHKTPAQILLHWAVSRGTIVIPKSVNPERIKENKDFFDFKMTEEDIAVIGSLNKNHRFINPVKEWKIPYFS